MKLTAFINFNEDHHYREKALGVLTRIAEKYRVQISLINTSLQKGIPMFTEIRLLIFIHPPSGFHSQAKNFLRLIRTKSTTNIVCIIGSSLKSAFPGTFSVSRFCEQCQGILEIYLEPYTSRLSICNCNFGPSVDIYPSEEHYMFYP